MEGSASPLKVREGWPRRKEPAPERRPADPVGRAKEDPRGPAGSAREGGEHAADVADRLGQARDRIARDLLVLEGDDDFICDQVSHASRIHAGIKSSKLSVIKNAGHFIWIEQPQTFYQAIEEWLKTKK